MTRQRLKECLLCGALLRPAMAEKHVAFHKSTPQVPKRTTITNHCDRCGRVLAPGEALRHTCRPPVLEEPSRRPAPLTPGMRAAAQRQRDRQAQKFAQDIGDAPGPPRVTHDPDEKPGPDDVNGLLYVPIELQTKLPEGATLEVDTTPLLQPQHPAGMHMVCSVINCGFEYESSGSGAAPVHKNSWTHACTGSGVVGAPVDQSGDEIEMRVLVGNRFVETLQEQGASPDVIQAAARAAGERVGEALRDALPHRAVPADLPRRQRPHVDLDADQFPIW